MSVILNRNNRIETHPIELIAHLVRRFNGVTRKKIIKIRSTTLEIVFDKFEGSNNQAMIRLFTKLAKSFAIIKDKYLNYDENKIHVRIKVDEDEISYIIKLIGINKIPPGKIFNLFSLILWYYIKFISGVKPGASIYGKELNEKWKVEEIYTRNELRTSQKMIIVTNHDIPCFICGEHSKLLNIWKFHYKKENRYIDVKTRVCDKHRHEVI